MEPGLERLRGDISRLFFLADEQPAFSVSWWTRTEEATCAARDYAMVDPSSRDFRLSKKMLAIDDPHRLGILAHEVGHVLAFHAWGDDSEPAADRAAKEFLKLPIYYDHAYGAGGKGLQTLRPPRPTKNPFDREAFARERDDRKAKHGRRVQEIADAFDTSPAVVITDRWDRRTLYILSGDTTGSAFRVSRFGEDGPYGHFEASSLVEAFERVAQDEPKALEPIGDDEVIAWTTTPAFIEGAKHVAYQQAWNELGFLSSQEPDRDKREQIYELRRAGDRLVETDGIDAGVRYLHSVIAGLRVRSNPSMTDYLENPTPWVTKVLANSYEQLEEMVPPAWLPKLVKTTNKRTTFTGKLVEFGCGVYGCVLPTLDARVVLKVSSDESEADFAKRLARHLPTPIVTAYYKVADIEGIKRQGDRISLLWRESAEQVGKIDTVVGQHAEDAIAHQHDAAKAAFLAILEHKSPAKVDKLMTEWRYACADMGHVPELEYVSAGLLEAESIGIFISDVHGGNLGLCTRNGRPTWVITDPGNVVVTNARFAK